MRQHYPEHATTLWALTVGPTVWALHFLLCYGATAIYCAKAPTPDIDLEALRLLILGFTAVALLAITAMGIYGYHQHSAGEDQRAPHQEDTEGDRYRFVGFATALLCGLSAVATTYVAIVVLFFESCR